MESNETQPHKLTIFQDGAPQINQNRQEGRSEDNLREKSKKICDDNCQQSLKLIKPSRKAIGIHFKNKTQERQVLSRVNGNSDRDKKANNIRMSPDLRTIQQNHNYSEGNGEIDLSEKLMFGNSQGYLNGCNPNCLRNQIQKNSNFDLKLRPLPNQNFKYKNQKIISNSKEPMPSHKMHQILTNQNLQMQIQGSDAIFPISNPIVQQNNLNKNSILIFGTLKPRVLPIGFSYLLQMLNLSYLFPELFKFEKETIALILQILQAPSNKIQNQLNLLLEENFKFFMNSLSVFIVEDLNNDRLTMITDRRTQNILSLAKFCQENQLFDFVFKYNWPLILSQLAHLSVEDQKESTTKFQESIEFMKKSILNQNFIFPENFKLRFQLISFLIDSYSKTNSFREFFNKKIEINRNFSKRKTEFEDEKKIIEQNIKKLQNSKQKKSKKIAKKDKKKAKRLQQNSEELSEKQCQISRTEALEKLQKQLEEIQQEIQKQNREDSLSCCHFLGKDRNNFLYWVIFCLKVQYVSYFPDKLFIEKNDSNWSFLQIDQINQLMESLCKNTVNENRLNLKIHEYYESSISKHLAKMEIETEQNNRQPKLGNLSKSVEMSVLNDGQVDLQHLIEPQNSLQHGSSKNSNDNDELLLGLGAFKVDQDSLLRMIEVGEKKMTEYLKDRNSRWGSEENKNTLVTYSIMFQFSTIKGSGPNWLEDVKKQISLFNQKICVVEIQYKVFVQQSVEQVDSKIKKIQTKIWGINQKFKHNWYDFISSCSCFSEVFFAVSVLYSLIKKYTSKHRKLRKEYEEIKQKTVWKSTDGIKQWKQAWNQVCEVCGNTGDVLCCDFCPKVYHLECVNLTVIPAEQFKCKSCTEQITTRHQLKSIANDGKRNGKR